MQYVHDRSNISEEFFNTLISVQKRHHMDLRAALPQLLPEAIAWAEGEASRVASAGRALTIEEVTLARKVGVLKPELIRIQSCSHLPMPRESALQAAAVQTGLLGPGMVGLTLGYSVFVCRGHETPRLLSHEFRHVYQYEQHGSVAGFLPVYLQQIVTKDYQNAPLEIDARAYESVARYPPVRE